MSALMSTFFLGWILPLAVTAATRSRLATFSKRTSTPRSRRAVIGVLDRDGPVGALQGQERLAHLRLHGQAARPHLLLQIAVLRARLGELGLTREVAEDGQGNREARLERLLRERERVFRVLAAQRLLVGAAPHVLAAVGRREPRALAELVVVAAAAVLLPISTLLPADDGVELCGLLREPRPGRRQGQRRAVTRGGDLHAPAGRPLAGPQRLERRGVRPPPRPKGVQYPTRRQQRPSILPMHPPHPHP